MATVTRTLETRKGRSVTTPLTDAQALEACKTLKGDFAVSLVQQAATRGISEEQVIWTHILAVESQAKAKAEKKAEKSSSRYPGIPAAFLTAEANGLKRLCLRLLATQDGHDLKLRLVKCGALAARPGHILITDDAPYGERTRYGTVSPEGVFVPAKDCFPGIVAALAAYQADPAKAARMYGMKIGECCFCKRELTTAESLFAGYGPICAARLDLPYGEVAPKAKAAPRRKTAPKAAVATA